MYIYVYLNSSSIRKSALCIKCRAEYIVIYIYSSMSLDVVQSLYFGSLLPKYRYSDASVNLIYIYNKFTEASHHNTLNIFQSRWM